MIAAFIKDSGTILDALSSFKHVPDVWMSLKLLELFVRIEIRILVVETNNVAEMNKIRLHVVHEATGVNIARHRPASRMLNMPSLEVLVVWCDFPDLLKSQPVMLHAYCVLCKLKTRFEVLGETSTRTFTEYSLLGEDFHAWHVSVFLTPIFCDAKRACDDTLDLAILFYH